MLFFSWKSKKDIEWRKYTIKYNKKFQEWETMWGKHRRVGHETLEGLKGMLVKLEDDEHRTMLSYFGGGMRDPCDRDPAWKHYGE